MRLQAPTVLLSVLTCLLLLAPCSAISADGTADARPHANVGLFGQFTDWTYLYAQHLATWIGDLMVNSATEQEADLQVDPPDVAPTSSDAGTDEPHGGSDEVWPTLEPIG